MTIIIRRKNYIFGFIFENVKTNEEYYKNTMYPRCNTKYNRKMRAVISKQNIF